MVSNRPGRNRPAAGTGDGKQAVAGGLACSEARRRWTKPAESAADEPALYLAMISDRAGCSPAIPQQQCDAPRQHAGPGDLPPPSCSRAEVGPRGTLHWACADGSETATVCAPDRPHSLTPVRWPAAGSLEAPSLIPETQRPMIALFGELGRRASTPGIGQFLNQSAPPRQARLAGGVGGDPKLGQPTGGSFRPRRWRTALRGCRRSRRPRGSLESEPAAHRGRWPST